MDGVGDIMLGVMIKLYFGKVFFGYSDGKVSMYFINDYICFGVISVSIWKINVLVGVGSNFWVVFNFGKICVYDVD